MSINLLKLLLKVPRKMPGNMAHWFSRGIPTSIPKGQILLPKTSSGVGVRKIGRRNPWGEEEIFDPAGTYESHNPLSFLKDLIKGRKVPYPSKASMPEGIPYIGGSWKTRGGQITRSPWPFTKAKGGGSYKSAQKGLKKAERELKSFEDWKEDLSSIVNTAANRLVGKPKGLGKIGWNDPRYFDEWNSVLEKVESSDSVARQLNLLKKLGAIPAGGASMYGLKKGLEGNYESSGAGFRDVERFLNLSPLDKLKMILTVPNRMYGGR